MSPQLYRKLPCDAATFRLLVLQSSSDPNASIRCTLTDVKLSESPSYEAVSYNWGPSSPLFPILVNEVPVQITRNLHDCLHRLRMTEENRNLWVDAICINQKDADDKSHQIRLMPIIYHQAYHVLAWLGQSADGSDDMLATAISITNMPKPPEPDSDRKWAKQARSQVNCLATLVQQVDHFLQRPYWKRTWIIQELLKARKQILLCGSTSIAGNMFHTFLTLLCYREFAETSHEFKGRREKVHQLLMGEDEGERAHAKTNLPDLLLMSHDTNCTDDRDRVYALLGLLPKEDRASSLKADYSLTNVQLCFRVLDRLLPRHFYEVIQTLLTALKLHWSAIVNTAPDLEMGFYTCTIQYPIAWSLDRQCFGGYYWAESCKLRQDDLCQFASSKQVCFNLRPVASGGWRCVGCTWIVLPPGRRRSRDLKALEDFLMTKAFSRYAVKMAPDSGEWSIFFPRLFWAVLHIYLHYYDVEQRSPPKPYSTAE